MACTRALCARQKVNHSRVEWYPRVRRSVTRRFPLCPRDSSHISTTGDPVARIRTSDRTTRHVCRTAPGGRQNGTPARY